MTEQERIDLYTSIVPSRTWKKQRLLPPAHTECKKKAVKNFRFLQPFVISSTDCSRRDPWGPNRGGRYRSHQFLSVWALPAALFRRCRK